MIYVSASTVSIGVIKGIAISFSSFPFNISDATSTFTEPSVFEIIVVPLLLTIIEAFREILPSAPPSRYKYLWLRFQIQIYHPLG